MKSYINICVISILLFSLIGCDENSNLSQKPDTPESILPNRYVLISFNDRHSNAQDIEWSEKDDYYVAGFTDDSWPAVAWFDAEGEWLLDQIATSSDQFDQIVSNTISGTAYSDWEISDAHILDRKGFGTVYMVGLEKDNEKSNFYFTKYGDFIKVINNTHVESPVIIPAELRNSINKLFNQPELVDIEWNNEIITEISIGLLDKFHYKIAALNEDYSWISTFWNLTEKTVPAIVLNGFNSSEYGINKIDNIKAMEDADGLSYIFYFKDSGEEHKNAAATLSEDGEIKVVLHY